MAEYATKRNGAAAARAAGYAVSSAKVTASRLLTKANVQAALRAYEGEARRLLGTTRDQVILHIQNAIETAKKLDEPMTAIAGWREIAKLLGYYHNTVVRKVAVSAEGQRIKADIELMTDAELIDLLERKSKAADRGGH